MRNMKGAVVTIEERLNKVEETLKLILEWALDNSNPKLVRKLKKYAEAFEDDSLFSIEGQGIEEAQNEGNDELGQDPLFVDEDHDFVGDSLSSAEGTEEAEVKDEEDERDPLFVDDDHGLDGDEAYQDSSRAGHQNRLSGDSGRTIDKLKMTPVVILTRITTPTTGSLSAGDNEVFQIESSQVQAPLPYSCNKCEKTFAIRSSLLRDNRLHVLATDDSAGGLEQKRAGTSEKRKKKYSTKSRGDWTCGVCHSVFPTQRTLIGHRQEKMHYVKRVTCNQCDETLPSQMDLLRHQRELHSEKSLNSDVLESEIAVDRSIRDSRKMAVRPKHISYLSTKRKGAGNWTCGVCKNVFPTNRALINHRQKETHYQRLLKGGCNSSRVGYIKHTLKIHDLKEPPLSVINRKWPCNVCNSEFSTRKILHEHRKKEMHYKQSVEAIVASHSEVLEHQQKIHKDITDSDLSGPKTKDTCQESEWDPVDDSYPEPRHVVSSQKNSKSDSDIAIATFATWPPLVRHNKRLRVLATDDSIRDLGLEQKRAGNSGRKKKFSTKSRGDWTCGVCHSVFPTHRTLIGHRQEKMHYVKRVKCNQCDETLPSKVDLFRHQRELHSEKSLKSGASESEVTIDRSIFNFRQRLVRPKYICYLSTERKGAGNWTCGVCKNVFCTNRELINHRQKEMHYKALLKGKDNPDEYIKHNPVIHDVKEPPLTVIKRKWPCSVCNSIFPTFNTMRKHKRKCKLHKDATDSGLSEAEKKDTCQESASAPTDDSFPEPQHEDPSQKNSMSGSDITIARKVMDNETSQPDNLPCTVPTSSKVPPNLEQLADSSKRENDSKLDAIKKTIWSCNVCDIVLPTKKELQAHKIEEKHYTSMYELKHPMATKHACPDCDYKSFKKATYERHRKTHNKERPYLCSTCGESFKTEEGLQSHSFKHTGEKKPFICKYCGSSFANTVGLQMHEGLHEGTKDELCPHCNRTFAHLKIHIDTVHKKLRRFECHLCDHKFKRGCHLKRHVATHNNPNRRVKSYHIERPNKPYRQGKRTVLRMCDEGEKGSTSADTLAVTEASCND